MNKNSTPTPSWYADTAWAVQTYTKQMSVMSFSSFEFLKLAISFFRIKEKTLYVIIRSFLRLNATNIHFYLNMTLCFQEFFYLYQLLDAKIECYNVY